MLLCLFYQEWYNLNLDHWDWQIQLIQLLCFDKTKFFWIVILSNKMTMKNSF